MPTLPPHYHVGIVVTDVPAARARLTEQLGVTWGPILHLDEVAYRDASGADIVLPTTMCYSVGQPCLELIEARPGTVWERNEHSNLHHIGIWSADLPGDSTALAGTGCPMQLCGRDDDVAPVSFTYHRDEDIGIRIELVNDGMREAMEFLFRADAETA
jgi:catechol 2,3-dioxygenase-like lactoylglutathione lyase family enzyme